jgi:predicted alpha/beta-fold hydrolase
MSVIAKAAGHFWTIAGDLRHRLAPVRVEASPWTCPVPAPWGEVTLQGAIVHEPGANAIALIVHGLGGSEDSAYALRSAEACRHRGLSSLRVSLRGADGRGEDIYHAGLVEDLLAALEHPAVATYDHVVIVGYSMGGHVALHASRVGHPKLRAVAAVCAPLDLARSCEAIDRKRSFAYRHYVLNSLKRAYRAFAARRSDAPTDPSVVDRIRSIHAWDELVVVPRHGFASVADYHGTQSIGPHLGSLRLPTLYLGARHDPMVTYASVAPALRGAGPQLEVHVTDYGGHVGYPPRVSLVPPAGSLESQVVGWLGQRLLDPS